MEIGVKVFIQPCRPYKIFKNSNNAKYIVPRNRLKRFRGQPLRELHPRFRGEIVEKEGG